MSERWKIDVTDEEFDDGRGRCARVRFESIDGSIGIAGEVRQPRRKGPPAVKSIERNDCCVPDRLARRLLRRIHHLYWPEVGTQGDLGIFLYVELAPFIHQQFREEAPRIIGLLRRAVRTFAR